MDLKFYLNKFIKVDNIENYTLKALKEIQKCYEDYLEKTEGSDPDFPMVTFGGKDGGGKKVKGRNAAAMDEDSSADFNDDIL
jgi:hypothetical protein